MTEVLPATVAETARLGERVLAEVEQVIVGKPAAIRLVLLGVLASGHILIEDLPGLGKTLLARTFATVLGLEFTRVQFTPDMLPADLTGAVVLDLATGQCGVPARPGVHRPAAGRRDQPDPAQDPGGTAGGDGRGPGQRRRGDPAAAAAVRGAGHR